MADQRPEVTGEQMAATIYLSLVVRALDRAEPSGDAWEGDELADATLAELARVARRIASAFHGPLAHDAVDESWWKAGREAIVAAGGKMRRSRRG